MGERGGGKEIQHHRNQVEGMKGKGGKDKLGHGIRISARHIWGSSFKEPGSYLCRILTSGAQAPYVWLTAHDGDCLGKGTSSAWDVSEEAEHTVL